MSDPNLLDLTLLVEAFKMGKHGAYVWSSYFIYAAFILGWCFNFRSKYQAQVDDFIKKRSRAAAYQRQQEQDGSSEEKS